jgi:hypothetical protein
LHDFTKRSLTNNFEKLEILHGKGCCRL